MGLGAKQHFNRAAHHRNTGGAADEHHFIDLLRSDTGVFHAASARPESAGDTIFDQVLEKLAGDFAMVALAVPCKIDVRDRQERQRLFGADDFLTERLNRLANRSQVLIELTAPLRLKVFECDPKQAVVDVVAP